MATLIQDLRYGLRMLVKNPGFTAVAVLTLALGIGANTAIFSVVNGVLLRSLPYTDPDRLVMVWAENPSVTFRGGHNLPPSNADVVDWRNQNHVFEHIAVYLVTSFNVSGREEAERVGAAMVSSDLFQALGVQPLFGGTFTAEEDQPGKNHVGLISYGLWRRRFGADPALVGKTITLNGEPFVVTGIMPPSFQFPLDVAPPTDVWAPLSLFQLAPPGWKDRRRHNMYPIARIKPGVTFDKAQAEMTVIARRLAQEYPETNAGSTVRLVPLTEQIVGKIRPLLLLLLGAVGFVLLIACANVANLLLARAASRQKEIAIRGALGAGRVRVIRQLVTESVLLSLFGGILGILIADWGVKLVIALSPSNIPRLQETRVDGWVALFTVALSLVTGLLFGLAPAVYAARTNLVESLKESAGWQSAARGGRVRSLLVISEIALALVLLIGAGLMIQSFWRLLRVDPGFNPRSVLAIDITLSQKYSNSQRQRAFLQEALERLRTLPGVESAGAISFVPLFGKDINLAPVAVEGRPLPLSLQGVLADERAVTPDYFRTLGIPLIRGRFFTEHDTEGQPRVVIVSETLARRHFPNEDPIGKRIVFATGGKVLGGPFTIVGLVGDVKSVSLEAEPRAQVYEPFAQSTRGAMTFLIRADWDLLKVTAAARNEIRSLDAELPVTNVRTMNEVFAGSVARPRFYMVLLGLFAGLALVLTVVGLYGVVSYSVSQRIHEIGIRMALGAAQPEVMRLVLRQGLRLALAGTAIGFAAAVLLTRLLRSILFGVRPTDPLTFAGVALLLTATALLASYIPARRATKVDPMVALRYE